MPQLCELNILLSLQLVWIKCRLSQQLVQQSLLACKKADACGFFFKEEGTQ